ILDVDLLDAHHLGLLAGWAELLALTEIGGEGDNLGGVSGLPPSEDDRGVEAARIGEHHLLHIRHVWRLFGGAFGRRAYRTEAGRRATFGDGPAQGGGARPRRGDTRGG